MVRSHGDGDQSQGHEAKEMEEHFDESILFIGKLGRNEFQKGDVNEDAGGQRLEYGGCHRSCRGGHLLDEQAQQDSGRDGCWKQENVFNALWKRQLLSRHGDAHRESHQRLVEQNGEEEVEDVQLIRLQSQRHTFK